MNEIKAKWRIHCQRRAGEEEGGAELIPAPMGNKRPVGLKDTKRIQEFWLGGLQYIDSENTV